MTTGKETAISSYQCKEAIDAGEVRSLKHVASPELLISDREKLIEDLFGNLGPLGVVGCWVFGNLKPSGYRRQVDFLVLSVIVHYDEGYPVVV